MDKLWYKGVTYENAKELVKENLVNTVTAFIASGYWLKYIRDSREYEKDGYQSLWDCTETEFGLKINEASRAMHMNDKYSIDGNTPYMSESYKQYNKSQLQEMLTMSDEQMVQVMPDMTVREIRETYSSNTVIEIISSCFIRVSEQRSHPSPPNIKELMGYTYCSVWQFHIRIAGCRGAM